MEVLIDTGQHHAELGADIGIAADRNRAVMGAHDSGGDRQAEASANGCAIGGNGIFMVTFIEGVKDMLKIFLVDLSVIDDTDQCLFIGLAQIEHNLAIGRGSAMLDGVIQQNEKQLFDPIFIGL